jgi:restriction endonuclease
MKIHFEPNLKHQSEAVAATVRVFEGAPYTRPEERFWTGDVSSNILKLAPEEWKANVAVIAAENGIDDYARPTSATSPSKWKREPARLTYIFEQFSN